LQRYFLHLSYHGSAYHGWQRQDNAHSVQQELETCLSLKLRQKISLTGCGRTDTGVHAWSFYAHFDMLEPLDIADKSDWITELNAFLPKDVAVFDLLSVKPNAHARFDALERSYKYVITRKKDPFRTHTAYYVFGDLNVEAMQRAAEILKTYNDFTSFAKLHSKSKTNYCEIYQAEWTQKGDLLIFTITADRFLRDMVRAITGTLLDIGKEKYKAEGIRSIIEAKDRGRAGVSVPAHALFLYEIKYPEEIFI